MFCFYYDEVQQSYYGTSNSIEGYLDYIYAHDKYKAAIERGETVTKFSSKKYARHEAKAQRKRAKEWIIYFECWKDRMRDIKNCLTVNE